MQLTSNSGDGRSVPAPGAILWSSKDSNRLVGDVLAGTQASICLDRYRTALRVAASPAYQDLVSHSDRFRCLDAFERARKILLTIGLPEVLEYEARPFQSPPTFAGFLRSLILCLQPDLARHLDLKFLLTRGKRYRDAIAHSDPADWNTMSPRACAERLERVVRILADGCEELFDVRCDETNSSTANTFYKLIARRAGLLRRVDS